MSTPGGWLRRLFGRAWFAGSAVDVLACPHCQRTFRAQPAVFGKTIRCRGCRQIFQTPSRPEAVAQPFAKPMAQPVAQPAMAPPAPRVVLPDARRDVPQDMPPSKRALREVLTVFACGLVAVAIIHTISHFAFSKTVVVVPDTPDEIDNSEKSPDGPPVDPPVVPQVVPPLDPPAASPAPPPLAAPQIDRCLAEVFAALQRQDFDAADRGLADCARDAGTHPETRSRHGRWRMVASYARNYAQHRDAAFKAANQGREYELDGELFSVAEIGPDVVVYRLRGVRHRDPRATLDPRIEMAIVGKWFAGDGRPANHIYLGVRWLCCSPPDLERCRAEWRIAAAGGAPVSPLLPLLDDPVVMAASR